VVASDVHFAAGGHLLAAIGSYGHLRALARILKKIGIQPNPTKSNQVKIRDPKSEIRELSIETGHGLQRPNAG